MSEMLTIAEVAARLGRSCQAVKKWAAQGRFSGAVKANGRWLIPAESLDRFELPPVHPHVGYIPRQAVAEAWRELGDVQAVAERVGGSPVTIRRIVDGLGISYKPVRAPEPAKRPAPAPEPAERPALTPDERTRWWIYFYLRGIRLEPDDFCPPTCRRWWRCLDDGDQCGFSDNDDANYA